MPLPSRVTQALDSLVHIAFCAQEHNTDSPARAPTRTAWSGIQRANHKTTAPSKEESYFVK